jgi:hypothetical protein
MAVTMASAMLGIVSASTAALASMNFIHSVQLRTLSRGAHRRAPSHPALVAPFPQPALAQAPAASHAPSPEPASLLSLFTPPSLLARAGGSETHDPAFLVARARRLADAGADVIVNSVRLRYDVLDRAAQSLLASHGGVRLVPVLREGEPAGLRIESSSGTLFSLLGVRDGDVVTAINGYSLFTIGERATPISHGLDERLMVAELVREGHRIVVAVSWPDDRSPAPANRHDRGVVQNVPRASRLHPVPTETTTRSTARNGSRRSTHGARTRIEGGSSGVRSSVTRPR